MTTTPTYTEFHPRWYRRRIPTLWWLRRRSYFIFVLRELSSVFVAWFVIFLILLLKSLGDGGNAYHDFLNFAKNPVVIAVNVIALLFLIFHAFTWFNLAPQAMVVRFRGERVPPLWIAAANYGLWVVVTAVVAWLVLRS